MNDVLTEEYVQDSFHSYLKSSLTQAKAEKLLDVDTLSSAESDLMITGPALCLYFAALRCTTNPPSVPLPRPKSAKSSFHPIDLSFTNCPSPFIAFLRVWAHTVHPIQALVPEHQHDLARVICGLDPLSSPLQPAIGGIAADLRAVAIEISQRRSFQDRFAEDLQAALDSGTEPGSPNANRKALFVPPPVYDPSPPTIRPIPVPTRLGLSPSPSTPFLSPTFPTIDLIRETLYASLASVISTYPSLRNLLSRDAPRAYFSSVSLSILDASTALITSSGSIISAIGTPITLDACPDDLRAFMRELIGIGTQAREMMEEDSLIAAKYLQRGDELPVPKIDRVKEVLEGGVGYVYKKESRNWRNDEWRRKRSIDSKVVTFSNRINALSLGMTRLRAFKERQDGVFKILVGVRS